MRISLSNPLLTRKNGTPVLDLVTGEQKRNGNILRIVVNDIPDGVSEEQLLAQMPAHLSREQVLEMAKQSDVPVIASSCDRNKSWMATPKDGSGPFFTVQYRAPRGIELSELADLAAFTGV